MSKQSWGWWFETPSCSLWRHCNALNRMLRSQTMGSKSATWFISPRTWPLLAEYPLIQDVASHGAVNQLKSLRNWILYMVAFHFIMITSSNGNIFRVIGPLCGEFTGHRWIPHTKASDALFDVFFDLRLNNNREAGDLTPRAHYDVTVMWSDQKQTH